MRNVWVAVVCGLVVTGCAKNADQVAATYVSPVLYENYTCPQLGEEAQRVSARAAHGLRHTWASLAVISIAIIAVVNGLGSTLNTKFSLISTQLN